MTKLPQFVTKDFSLLDFGSHQVSVECDVNVSVIAVDGVISLTFVKSHPHLIIEL